MLTKKLFQLINIETAFTNTPFLHAKKKSNLQKQIQELQFLSCYLH